MDDKLETLQAEDQLAVSDPQAYLVSNPTPRDWNLSTQDIARSIRIDDPRKMLGLTNEDIQGPRKLSMIETIGKGIWDNITDNPIKESNETRMFYSSPNMTEEEATRLMNDVLYTDYKRREAEIAKDAAQIKYKKTYGFSNGVGSAIKYAFLGFLGGPTVGTAAIGALAGAESAAQVETDLADRYIDKYGKNYTKEEMWKDTGLASAYGAFAGFTEASLGIERIAAGALGRYSKLEALSRLARMEGKIYKSGALKAARRVGMSGVEEGGEEFIQSLGEDATVALAGYASDLTTDEVFSKAFTSAIYGAMIGGTMGWGLYRINRKSIIDKIKKWNDEKGAGLNDQQVVEMADQMLDDGKTKMLDEVATRVEIRNHYGKAYDLVKKRLMDQINATETVPWQDKAKTKEEYVETLADALTFPAINVANQLQIPLSDFLEIADVESWVIGNIVGFKPIRSVGDIDEIIAKQDAIIKDQREKKKLGIGNEQVLNDAQRRKTIAQRVRREVAQDQEIAKRRATSKKQTADYITARDVQPASVEALAGATTAQPGQDFVLVAGKKIPVEYQVVELSTIQPSHINGTPNPNYTNEQLQNRASRGTQQDVADLRGKALPENFTPERITRANTAAEGAPLVNAAGEVIAGNGRAEIVRYAYENPESAEKYKASLIEQGFNIEGMEQPILVRRNTTLTPDEQIAAADISNISETSAFDEASQARRDTQYLKDSATPTEFAAKLPMSDRRGLMQNNGRWNKRRVQQRYESALLSWLCGNDTQLFENLVLDRGISQKVIDVLTANGNLIYETATKYPKLNLREDIYNALVKMQYTTKNNFLEMTQQLSLDGHDVMPENILVWNWLYADGTTNRQFMNYYATTLANNQERVNAGEDMFGQKVAPLSTKDALIQALKKSDQAKAETSASNGRNYEPLFDDNGTTNNPELLAAIISYNNQFAPVQNIAGPQEYSDSEVLGIFAKALNNETIKLENLEYVRWSSLLGEGKKKRKTGIVYEPATDKQKASFARKMLDKYMPEWNQPTTSELLNKIEQFDLADENARLDDIYPAYDGETIEVDGKERTVYNSNGERIAKSKEALTNFWRWFGDSKAVDNQGKPLVLYHGSKEFDIRKFKLKKVDSENIFPEDQRTQRSIAFFTTNRNVADLFAWQGRTYPVYLRVENPETFDEKGKEWDEAKEYIWVDRTGLDKDGIIVKNVIEAPAVNDIVADDYIVFNNKQIKSVDNRGTYSSNTGNILNKIAYTSGATYYDRPSTEYVLRGGEGQIVHGWGVYSLADKDTNRRRYREGQFAGRFVYLPEIPKTNKRSGIITDNGTILPKIAPGLTDEQNVALDQTLITLTAQNIARNIAKGRNGYKSITYPMDVLMLHFYTLTPNAELKSKIDETRNILHNVYAKTYISPSGKTITPIENKPIPKLATRANASLFFIKDAIDDAKSVFHVKTSEITPEQLEMVLSEFLQDPEYMRKNIFTNDFLSQFAPNQTDEFYTELSNQLTNAINGTDPLTENFDNSIFKESGAKTLDVNSQKFNQVLSSIYNMKDPENLTTVDAIVSQDQETFGGFIGLYALAKQSSYAQPHDLFYEIATGHVTFDNIDKDSDYKAMKKKGTIFTDNDFFAAIIKQAKAIYDKYDHNDVWESETLTWKALSEAMRNLDQDTQDKLQLMLATSFDVKDGDMEMVFDILQNPEKLKKTRGQQLEIDVPEDNVLLDEDLPLAKQASADKLREIVKDFHWSFSRAFVDNIREKSWIQKHLDSDWKLFASKHGIKEKTLAEFAEKLDNEFYNGPMVDTMTPERELFIDYIMQTMHGDGLYQAIADILPETYIQLESGEEIGEVKDYDGKQYNVMGAYMPAELARDVALYLNDQGIKGIAYTGGIDGRGYVTFSDESIQTLNRIDDDRPMYYQKRGRVLGQYDPELQTIMLGKYWNELTLVHEFHHRYLELMWGFFKQAQMGQRTMPQEFINDLEKLFGMLEIDPNQESLTTVQQEKFTYMVEAYLTGLGVENTENLAFQGFLHWIPEKYKSIMDLGYLDENNIIQNPMLDEESIAWFNKWFASPFAPSLPSAPDAQRMINPTDNDGEIVPADQKTMNNREKEWGQDSEEQLKADAQLWRAIDENMAGDARAAIDGEKELMKAETKNLPDDTKLPEQPKQTLREKWFKARVQNARERAAEMARKYVAENPDHARELAFADPETMTEYDAPVDQGMLIRAVMETVPQGSEEWYLLDNNLAMVKSMSGSTLALSGDQSHQAYLDAKREIEAARELKAATNYAGTSQGAMEKWNADIRAFIAARTAAIVATEPESAERQAAIKAMLEEAKTKFSANTTNAILNQLDLTGMRTKDSQVFIKWAEKQIKQAAHARIDTKEQQELMKASIAAQLALKDIDSTEVKDGKYVRAMQSGKDIRHWQFVKDKMKKAYIGRWGKFGIFMDNLFGSYAPSAMLMSVNTLFFANVPSTAVNTATTRIAAHAIGKNLVDSNIQSEEIKRIKQVFNASGVNLAQMDKPTSPSMLHGEKYTNQEQKHWYNFTFDVLGREDNVFRVPTFVDALARIATKNANGDKAKANALFKEYCQLNTTSEEAKIARKQALAVANMAVFTQDGIMASALNHIRSSLNTMSRGLLGLQPNGFGLGNILAPFLKTGANITEMGLSATLAPVRLVMTAMQKLQGKEIPDVKKIALLSDWINLAWMSVVIAVIAAINSDDDEWYIEPYQPGQAYDPDKPYDSVNFGGVWVKVDIFGPLAIPLRAAMKAVNGWEKRKMAAVADGLFFGGMEALSDTPLVNQVTDSSLDYMVKKPGAYWQGFGYNQLNKLVPSQLKSISRATTRGANVEYSGEWMGKTIGKKFHRNYGLDGQRLTTNDLINILTNRLKVQE